MTPAFAELEADSIRRLDAYRQLIADAAEAERAASVVDRQRQRTAQMIEQQLGLLGCGGVRPVGGEAAQRVRNARRRRRAARQALVGGDNRRDQQVLQGFDPGLCESEAGFGVSGHRPLQSVEHGAERTAPETATHRLSETRK